MNSIGNRQELSSTVVHELSHRLDKTRDRAYCDDPPQCGYTAKAITATRAPTPSMRRDRCSTSRLTCASSTEPRQHAAAPGVRPGDYLVHARPRSRSGWARTTSATLAGERAPLVTPPSARAMSSTCSPGCSSSARWPLTAARSALAPVAFEEWSAGGMVTIDGESRASW